MCIIKFFIKNMSCKAALNELMALCFLPLTLLLPLKASADPQDYRVEATLASSDNDATGIMFRYVDSQNYYRFSMNSQSGYRRLDKIEDGVVSILAQDSFSYVINQSYDVVIQANGDALSVMFDGEEILSANDSAFAQGAVAFYSAANSGSYFDNLVVSDLTTNAEIANLIFTDQSTTNELSIVDDGDTSGPSNWSISTGRLRQSSNIYLAGDPLARGTYAVIDATVGDIVGSPEAPPSEPLVQASPHDYKITVTLESADNDNLGVMFRYVDSNNYYRFVVNNQAGFRRLDKVENGVYSILDQDAVSYVINQSYNIEISARGEQLNVAIDGEDALSATDAAFEEGGVALYSGGNAGSYFDNFRVTNLFAGTELVNQIFSIPELMEDITIIDEGDTSGPSSWSIKTGRLVQTSNIYFSGDPKFRGTYALFNATMDGYSYSTVTTALTKEFTVNTVSAGQQLAPSIAANDNGQYAIAWEDDSQGNSNVLYSVYESDGTPIIQDQQINPSSSGIHHSPQLILHNDASVTAIWQADSSGGDDDIRLRGFDAAGNETLAETTAHTSTSGNQIKPSVAVNGLGQFVIAWEGDAQGNMNVFYRLFDESANPISNEVQINQSSIGSHHQPRLLLADDKSVIAAWQEDHDGNNYYNIQVRGFDEYGQENLAGFMANVDWGGHQYRPDIARLPNDGFVIAYEDDKDGNGIFDLRIRGFNSDGTERFADKQLNFNSPVTQGNVSLANLSQDRLVALWAKEEGAESSLVARLYDAQGNALSHDVVWTSNTDGTQKQGAIIEINPGRIVATWADDDYGNGYFEVMANEMQYWLDRDRDGVADSDDAFPDDPAEWLDSDGDGAGNNQDSDDDNDGLPDVWEVANGLDPLFDDAGLDSDSDGVSNSQEYLDGTDPKDPASCETTSCIPVVISFQASSPDIVVGETVSLSWDVVNADSVAIAGLGNDLAAAGSMSIAPTTSTTYVITAGSSQGQATAEVNVDVYSVLSESTYNAMGQRVTHTVNGVTSYFVYGQGGELLAELDQDGNTISEHVYLDSLPVAQVAQSGADQEIFFIHSDHLGTPQVLTDENQDVVWKGEYSPFGEVNEVVNTTAQDIRFPGQYHDRETGYYYNYFRDYDPALGRYITSDPIGLNGGVNTYGYVLGNPLGATDPLGLDLMVIGGGRRTGSLNFFGHVASAYTGYGTFSYGNDTALGGSTTDYIQSQSKFRDQLIVIVPSTLAQDTAAVVNFYINYPDPNGVGYFDNCAVRTNEGLMNAGFPSLEYPFPGGLVRNAASLPNADTYFIPKGGAVPKPLVDKLHQFDPLTISQ